MKTCAMMLLAALTALCPCFLHAQNNVVRWSVLDAGFATLASGNTRVMSVVGQPFTGSASLANDGITAGFLVYPLRPSLSSGIQANGGNGLPATYELSQNYPNPFNPTTTIRFALPHASAVHLVVYNVLGQEVAVLADEVRAAGYHTVVWNGMNKHGASVSSGVYIFSLTAHDVSGASSFSQLKKMILLR